MWRRLLILVISPAIVFGQAASDSPVAERRWTVPSGAEFGSPAKDSIRVAVLGYAVKQPGYYYLAKGAAVQDAVVTAGIRSRFGWDPPYSGIQRAKPDGSFETIRFTATARETAEKISLRDGDVLMLSHEVY